MEHENTLEGILKIMNHMLDRTLLNAPIMNQDERLLLDIRDKDHVAIEVKYHKVIYLLKVNYSSP